MIFAQELSTIDSYKIHIEWTQSSSTTTDAIFIHGSPSSIHDLSSEAASTLTKRLRIISFDRPGHLLSPLHENRLSLADQARLVSEIAKLKSKSKPLLIAHSLGGAIALKTLLTYPHQFSGALLVNPWVYRRKGESTPGTTMMNMMRLFAAGRVLRAILAKTLGAAAIQKNLVESAKPIGISDEKLAQLLFRHTLPQSILALMEEKYSLLSEIDQLKNEYRKIDLPVAIISGKDDAIIPFSQSTELLADLPQALLLEEAPAGHSLSHISAQNFKRAMDWILGEGESNASVQGL